MMAVATPAMLPVPMVAPSAVMNDWKGVSTPPGGLGLPREHGAEGFRQAPELHEAEADGEEEAGAEQHPDDDVLEEPGRERFDELGHGAPIAGGCGYSRTSKLRVPTRVAVQEHFDAVGAFRETAGTRDVELGGARALELHLLLALAEQLLAHVPLHARSCRSRARCSSAET